MFKRVLMKKMLGKKLQGIPEADQDKLFDMVEKNPALFQKIATEIKALQKSGKDQMAATVEVMSKYQSELKGLM
ncbi:hypothetical protein IIB51_01160 [Patescibacteria group bacterium]|nr:hypothetical protein [Patescibacteria group bacterium]MCH8889012.1 hypothetical protein [Patescibacteria group bacterium]